MLSNTLPWIAVVLGWPAVIVSIAVVVTGVALGRSRVALYGALIGCPFLLYLFASPRIGWLSPIVGALYLGSAQAVARSQGALALVLATPFVALAGFVAWIVLSQ